MFLMIDNYDSFSYNLARYFEEVGAEIRLVLNDEISLDEIRKMNIDGIIISPGPKKPEDAGISKEVIEEFAGKVPIFGVCLGHQAIANIYGAKIIKGSRPMHGKVSKFTHEDSKLFKGIPNTFNVTRYHSLVVDENTLSKELKVIGRCNGEEIMAIEHKKHPIFGVQFHPEAHLTEFGHLIIKNFVELSKEWWEDNDS